MSFFSRHINREPLQLLTQRTEDNEMRKWKRVHKNNPPKKPTLPRTPTTDRNYAVQLAWAAVEYNVPANDWRNEESADKFDISTRSKLSYDMDKFAAARNLETDNVKLASEYIKEVFGLTLVKPTDNEIPNLTRNQDFFRAKAYEMLGDHKTAAVFYGRWTRNQIQQVNDYIAKRYGHVHDQIRSIDIFLNKDGSIAGNTVEENTKNHNLVFSGGNFGGRDNMRRTIKVLRYVNRAYHKIFSQLPIFHTPDVQAYDRNSYGQIHLLVSPPKNEDVLNSRLSTEVAKARLFARNASVSHMRVEKLREENREKEKEVWDLLDENLALESHIESQNKTFEWLESHPDWISQQDNYFEAKVSDAVASHRKFYLEKKSLPRVGIYNFRGIYKSAERVNDNDEVFVAYRDEYGDANISLDGIRSGVKPAMRVFKIRRLNLEDRRRLDLWRQANSAGKYNSKQTYDDEAFVADNVFCNLKLPVSMKLYMIAVTIALAVRSFMQRIIPSAVENWEIRDASWNVIPLVNNPINLGYYIFKPITALADVIQETVYALGSVEIKPAFMEIRNKFVNTMPIESSMARENPLEKKYPYKYFLWQPNLQLMHTIIGGKWVFSEKLAIGENNVPVREIEKEFDVYSFIVGRNSYFRVDDYSQPLNEVVDTFKEMPFKAENGDMIYVESVKTFPERQKIEHQSLFKKRSNIMQYDEDDAKAFFSVDTSGLEVPQVIDAPHVPLAEEAFEIDADIISDSEPSEISVKVPDEIIMPAYKKLSVKIRDIHDRIMDAGILLDRANHTNFSVLIWGADDNVDRSEIHDDLAKCLEQFLDRMEIKSEPYLATLFKMMVQMEYGNFHTVTLFPIHGIKEELAMEIYLALTGIGIKCAAIKVPHHNFAGSSRDGYGEQLSYVPYGSEAINSAGDGLLFEAQHMFSKHRDLKWMVISNAIPVLGRLNGTEETYIAATCIYAADEFMSTSYIALPAKIADMSDIKEGDFSPLPDGYKQSKIGNMPIIVPNVIELPSTLPKAA